ncbi:MAG: helix-turn-helix transcriptional regulator [Acidobacteriia bacterium]|nr:helix-turn-helix transcriptional regulator [Terriglobia bacterium]
MKTRPPQLTRQTMLILSILMGNAEPLAGSKIANLSGLASGTLYPILIRLEEAGWIKSKWESPEETAPKPRRRLYSVTGIGVQRARAEAAEWKPLVKAFV